jgi:hypothetical protein
MATDAREYEIRIGRNQALFREVNERIEGLRSATYPLTEIDVICECADDNWFARLSVTLGEYEGVRARGDTFLVLPEHIYPDAETVAGRHERYWIVKKRAIANGVALATDPRRGNGSSPP